MKLYHVLAALAAVVVFALTGCGESKEAKEKAAVEQFRREAEGLEVWMKEKQKAVGGNPQAGVALMKELVAKLESMKSQDLPDDLEQAWNDFVEKIARMEVLLAEMGADPAEISKKASADPQFLQKFTDRMKAVQAEMRPAAERLKEVGKKYGLEKVGDLAPK